VKNFSQVISHHQMHYGDEIGWDFTLTTASGVTVPLVSLGHVEELHYTEIIFNVSYCI